MLEVHDWQLAMTDEQVMQVLAALRYWFAVQEVQVVPLPPPLQRVQKVEFVQVVQLGMAALQDRQIDLLR